MEPTHARSWLHQPETLAPRPNDPPAEAADGPLQRRALCDQVFGRGFRLPGGEPELLRLVRPMHLTPLAKLLVVGCGVAGPCRALAAQLGVQASGYERQRDGARATAAAEGVAVAPWLPARDHLPAGEFHHALALHPLEGDVPEPLLAGIVRSLRPAAQLILVDYVASDSFDPTHPDTRLWMRAEGRGRPPDTEQDLARVLGRLGLHLRSAADMSRAHTRLAVFDWRRMLNGMRERPTTSGGQIMLDEAEVWADRARLLEQEQLRLVRLHATMPIG